MILPHLEGAATGATVFSPDFGGRKGWEIGMLHHFHLTSIFPLKRPDIVQAPSEVTKSTARPPPPPRAHRNVMKLYMCMVTTCIKQKRWPVNSIDCIDRNN